MCRYSWFNMIWVNFLYLLLNCHSLCWFLLLILFVCRNFLYFVFLILFNEIKNLLIQKKNSTFDCWRIFDVIFSTYTIPKFFSWANDLVDVYTITLPQLISTLYPFFFLYKKCLLLLNNIICFFKNKSWKWMNVSPHFLTIHWRYIVLYCRYRKV